MQFSTVMRPLALICSLLVTTTIGTAQSRITMDNEACVHGLTALATLVKAQINPASPPRKIASKCEAQNVSLTASGVAISIKQMQWNRAGFSPLINGELPQRLKLTLRGVTVTAAPKKELAWHYLVSEAKAGRSFNAALNLQFKPASGVLTISDASLDFHNGNGASLTAQLRGVSPNLSQKPELGALTIIMDDLTFAIHKGNGGRNQAMDLAVAALQANLRGKDIAKFKTLAAEYIGKEMGQVLSGQGLSDLKALITDLPKPKANVFLRLQAAGGFAILRLALLKSGSKLATALDGVDVEFSYGSDG